MYDTTDIKTTAIRDTYDAMNAAAMEPTANAWGGFDIETPDNVIRVCADDTDVIVYVFAGRARLIDSTVHLKGAAARSGAVIVATIEALAVDVTA